MVAATTVMNTPTSKNAALATGTSPTTGNTGCRKALVRNGYPSTMLPTPVITAISKPAAIQG